MPPAVPYQFKPHERPLMPGSPATPDHPVPRRIGYVLLGILIGLAGGFANGLLTANLPQIQGALDLSPVEGGWLTAIYSMTNICMSLLLIKFRQQFGLQRFTRLFLLGFLVITFAQIFVHSFAMELVVRGAAGIVGSGLTTLSFFYFIQAMPPARRMVGMIIGFSLAQVALPLARMLSPLLLLNGRVQNLFVFEFGLTLLCLGSVALLRLPPSERMKAFEKLDFLTFLLVAPGMALLCAVLVQGRIVWWSTPWLGYATAAAILLIGLAGLVEHNRANPLLNTRWMGSRDVLRFMAIAASIRILLSEQTYGSVGLMNVIGLVNDQLVSLNLIVALASIAGMLVGAFTLDMKDLLRPVVVATALIAIGAYVDSHASNLTRPSSLYVSQAVIAFAALYFMGSVIVVGIMRALSRGPSHIVSFSALFGLTQQLGGLAGAALLGSFQILREKFHSSQLVESLVMTDPQVATRVQQLGGAYGRILGDPALRQAEGAALLGQQVTREANILAYNDVFLAIALLAALVFLWLGTRWVRLRVRGINPIAEDQAAFERMREETMKN
ncbi:MAG: transporter [Alphaproteobacteria bacterium]|nr:transporter [Alphaproteobacteria bacterium]